MDAIHDHIAAYLADVASLPGGTLRDEDGVIVCTTGIPWPMFNGMLAAPDAGADACARAVAELEAAGVPWFCWQLPDSPEHAVAAAQASGAVEFDHRAPWMECAIDEITDLGIPAGVVLIEVDNEATHRLWARTLREIYDFPQAGEDAWVTAGERCGWTGLPWRQWIALAEGEPVGVTLLYCGGGIAGLFGVGVRRSARRRGIGAQLTTLPLTQATDERAGFFATAAGEPLYKGLGFETRGWVSRWLGGPVAAEELGAK